jgi:uncharacterized protein (TIGR02599 family)
VEVLVSTALLALIMALVMVTVDGTQRVMTRTTTKVSQFQAARTAFDTMTRRLSQATLNTYYRSFDTDTATETANFRYTRESELQFMTAPTAKIFSSPALANLSPDPANSYPGHAMFFFAPLGYTAESETNKNTLRFRNLSSALNATGFFVEYGDEPESPAVLRQAQLVPERKRFRLVELAVPTEQLTVYRRPLDVALDTKIDPQILDVNKTHYIGMVDRNLLVTGAWKRPLWMVDALQRVSVSGTGGSSGGASAFRFLNGRTLAENIVALIVLPKLAPQDRVVPGTTTVNPDRIDGVAPNYQYDSWRIIAQSPGAADQYKAARYHQLPPIVQITMVAVDESSGARIADYYKADLPKWTDGLFKVANTDQRFRDEMTQLEDRLQKDPTRPNYRIFSADVVLRGSKWSEDERITITTGTP